MLRKIKILWAIFFCLFILGCATLSHKKESSLDAQSLANQQAIDEITSKMAQQNQIDETQSSWGMVLGLRVVLVVLGGFCLKNLLPREEIA